MYLHPLLSVGLSTLDVFQVIMGGCIHGLYVTFGGACRSSDPVPWVYPGFSNQSHLLTHQLVDHLLLLAHPDGISRSIHRSGALGILLTALNLRFAQSLIPRFSND